MIKFTHTYVKKNFLLQSIKIAKCIVIILSFPRDLQLEQTYRQSLKIKLKKPNMTGSEKEVQCVLSCLGRYFEPTRKFN